MDGACTVDLSWRSERNHSVELVPAINRAFDQVGASTSDLKAVFVASGPGGFSALRVGMSTAKALASTLSIPLVTIGTLDLEAIPYTGLGWPVCAIVSAGRARLYVGRQEPGEPTMNVDLSGVDEFMEMLAPGTIYCGEAVADIGGEIEVRLGSGDKVVNVTPPSRPAARLARVGFERLELGETADAASVEPVYLRSSQVTSAARRWGAGQSQTQTTKRGI